MRVSVIIPTINGLTLLRECLPALERQTFRDFETIVIDDGGSTDGTAEYIRSHHPSIRLRALDRNRGYAGACNEGFRDARGELVGVLGNDNRPEPDWLAELVKALDARPDAALVFSKSPEPEWSSPDPFGTLSVLGYNTILTENLGGRSPRETLYGSGNAFLCRRDRIECFYDEEYGMYGEDVSLGWRLRLRGEKVLYVPASVTRHLGSQTTSRNPARKVYFQTRNRVLNLLLHFQWGTLLRLAPWLLADVVATILLRDHRVARARAYSWLALHLPTLFRKRRRIQESRTVSDEGILPYFAPPRRFTVLYWRCVGFRALGSAYEGLRDRS